MRLPRYAVVPGAVVPLLLGLTPTGSAAPATPPVRPAVVAPQVTKAELDRLREQVERATAAAEAAAARVEAAARRTSALRRALEALDEEREAAQDAFDTRVRSIYMRGQPDPLTQLAAAMANPDLLHVTAGPETGLADDQALLDALTKETAHAASLRRQAEQVRQRLLAEAAPALAAQDTARALLATAEAAFAADEAERERLRAQRERLDAASALVAISVAPAVTARGRRAAAAEAPVIELLERTCCAGLPPGYHSTGQVIRGKASWYGPGFVGNPTASGAPYDPERLTAAMLPPVPLGTVVRVTTDDGLAVNVLVNDRGPYVHGRVIDLSRAGSRLLGFDGVREVTVEILERD